MQNHHVTLTDALQQIPDNSENRFAVVLSHGSMEVEVYAPRDVDLQQPHTRDELYLVVRGKGMFVNGDKIHPFSPGDVLFVPAGVVHRFEEFSNDLTVWVVFYGPEGGEKSDQVTFR